MYDQPCEHETAYDMGLEQETPFAGCWEQILVQSCQLRWLHRRRYLAESAIICEEESCLIVTRDNSGDVTVLQGLAKSSKRMPTSPID